RWLVTKRIWWPDGPDARFRRPADRGRRPRRRPGRGGVLQGHVPRVPDGRSEGGGVRTGLPGSRRGRWPGPGGEAGGVRRTVRDVDPVGARPPPLPPFRAVPDRGLAHTFLVGRPGDGGRAGRALGPRCHNPAPGSLGRPAGSP